MEFGSIPLEATLRPAQIACGVSSVHSVHDPTEGGFINGLIEMAWASEKEIEVDLEKVFVYRELRILCQEFGVNPLGPIASGALLLAVSPSDLSPIEKAFKKILFPSKSSARGRKDP